MAKTWDGQEIAPEAPFGAMVVVYRRGASGMEYLLLHRAHQGPDFEGDWAWTPPSGARLPGESIDACARRELYEEAGTRAEPVLLSAKSTEWVVYAAQVQPDTPVTLHDHEHDRYEWLPPKEALRRSRPEQVAASLGVAIEVIETEALKGGHMLTGVDHVLLAMPEGREEEARSFYGRLLGLPEVEKPESLVSRGGCWFESDSIVLHLGVQRNFVPATKAHVAFTVLDLAKLRKRLENAGYEVVPDTAVPGVERFYAWDPFGNRLEFIQDGQGFSQRRSSANTGRDGSSGKGRTA